MNGATCPVIISGMSVFPGFNDDGTGNLSPQYGLRVAGTVTYVSASNAFLHAATAGLSGSLSNSRAVVTRTGTWNSPGAITLVADTA